MNPVPDPLGVEMRTMCGTIISTASDHDNWGTFRSSRRSSGSNNLALQSSVLGQLGRAAKNPRPSAPKVIKAAQNQRRFPPHFFLVNPRHKNKTYTLFNTPLLSPP